MGSCSHPHFLRNSDPANKPFLNSALSNVLFIYLIGFLLFIYLIWLHLTACGTLVLQPEIEYTPPAMEAEF